MSFDHPRIMIVGAGGMGALFGAILREGGLAVTLYDPNADHIRAIQLNDLQEERFGGQCVAEEIGKANVIGGLTAMAGNLLGSGRVRDFSRVPSPIGEMGGGVSKRCEEIAVTFTKAGLETLASENIRRKISKKLLGNIAMSAISAGTNLNSVNSLPTGTQGH